jgi:hypothetical protein
MAGTAVQPSGSIAAAHAIINSLGFIYLNLFFLTC